MAIAESSREIIVGFEDGTVVVYDALSRQQNSCFYVDCGAAARRALVAGRKNGSSSGEIKVSNVVRKIRFIESSRRLVTASDDGRVRFWDFPTAGQSLSSFLSGTEIPQSASGNNHNEFSIDCTLSSQDNFLSEQPSNVKVPFADHDEQGGPSTEWVGN